MSLVALLATPTVWGMEPTRDSQEYQEFELHRLAREDTTDSNPFFAHVDNDGLMRELLAEGVDMTTDRGWRSYDFSLLHSAAREGRVEDVRALLEDGADVNGRDELYGTPLHQAVFADRPTVQLLLDHGAHVNARNCYDQNPLLGLLSAGWLLSIDRPDCDVVQTLIQAGADVHQYDSLGAFTSLHYAAQLDSAEVIRMLVAAGAKVDARGGSSSYEYPASTTPLHLAASRSTSTDTAHALIHANANLCSRDGKGNTPLQISTGRCFASDMTRALLETGTEMAPEDDHGFCRR